MIGLGTIVNVIATVAGGLVGPFLKHRFTQRFQEIIMQALGLSVLFIGVSGTLQKLYFLQDGAIASKDTMLLVLPLVIGGVIGEALNIQKRVEQFGTWLKKKSNSEGDSLFVDGFLTATLTICVGAMAVVGSLQDGMLGDPSLLYTKALLDGLIIAIFATSMGKGVIFSAIPLGLFQGSITLLAKQITVFLTDPMIDNLSVVGNILIFCVGINLLFRQNLRVANLLPAIVVVLFLTPYFS